MKKRIIEIDFLKGVFITLMVMFHLNGCIPSIGHYVYLVHMPSFMIISGFLMNLDKPLRNFGNTILTLLVPYVIIGIIYLLLFFLLGSLLSNNPENAPQSLSLMYFLDRLFIHPGPGASWYIYDLILVLIVCYSSFQITKKYNLSSLIISCLILYFISNLQPQLENWVLLYFMLGYFIKISTNKNLDFTQIKTPLIFIVLCLIIVFGGDFNKGTLLGVLFVVSVNIGLITIYPYLPEKIKRGTSFVGKNSLVVLFFSPFITPLTKPFLRIMQNYDPTNIIYVVSGTIVTVIGTLVIAWVCDKVRVSRFIFLKNKIITE